MTERAYQTMRLPILQLSYRLSGKASHHPGLSVPLQPRLVSLRLMAFPKANIAVERKEICECDGYTVHTLSQRRLTADWLAPRVRNCSRKHSKVSFDWLSSYIKVTRPVLEVFKMDGYFPDSPRTECCTTMLSQRIYVSGSNKTNLGLHVKWPIFLRDFIQLSEFINKF